MSSTVKTPMLQTRNAGSILFNCAAFAVSASFISAMWMVMR